MDAPNPTPSFPTATITTTPTKTTADESAAIEVNEREQDRMDAIDSKLNEVKEDIKSIKQKSKWTEQEIKDAKTKAEMENPPSPGKEYWAKRVKQLEVQEMQLSDKERRLHEEKKRSCVPK